AGGLVAILGEDKRMVAGRVTFVLARGIGRAFLEPQVDLDAVRRVIADSYGEDAPTP
ncbi:MAG: hypothetical protein IIB67_11815, partial [Proteobacteria bacterium]|nr:hypothetical protein [Pseudomonadota bacterium]